MGTVCDDGDFAGGHLTHPQRLRSIRLAREASHNPGGSLDGVSGICCARNRESDMRKWGKDDCYSKFTW